MTTTEQIRNMIGDTTSPYNLTDEVISSFYSDAGTLYGAAALCLRSIIAKKAMSGKRVTAGDYSEDTSSFVKILSEMADKFEAMDIATPADSQVEIIHDDFSYRNILTNKILRGESLEE